jgi:hypothetical protein
LVGKPGGKRSLGRPRRRREDNIRKYLREIRWEGVDWIHLVQDRDEWWVPVNTVMNLLITGKYTDNVLVAFLIMTPEGLK